MRKWWIKFIHLFKKVEEEISGFDSDFLHDIRQLSQSKGYKDLNAYFALTHIMADGKFNELTERDKSELLKTIRAETAMLLKCLTRFPKKTLKENLFDYPAVIKAIELPTKKYVSDDK